MHRGFASVLRLGLLTGILVGLLFQPMTSVYAAASLTIIPITWNVVGLDSNNVNVGPNNFPVGVRVCNVGDATATNVGSTFVWDSANVNINLRTGSNSSYSGYTLAAGACVDFYYEVTITRTSAAYNTARRYHITASAAGLTTISTTTPREIFVERLVSQNRNSVTDVQLDGVSVAAGGTMSLLVGNTYNIKLVGNTSTNGYEQVESFINFPNTIFQVNSVTTTYTANAGTDPLAASKPYANGCGWINDPTSPNYRSCTGTGKYGGNITVTYNVTIIGGGGTSQVLNTLIYDFSGSSYHYNSDFSTSSRIASIIDPTSLAFSKAFSPSSTSAGGISTLTFTITNPTSSTFTGVNFTDVLPTSPGPMRVASPASYSTSGCGTPTFAPAANDATLTFSNGTLAANGTCTISVVVSVPATPTTGTYSNTSNHLFVNSLDTGKFATANLALAAASSGSGICGLTLARWTIPSGSTNPPDKSGGAPTTQAGNVATATASTTTTGAFIDTNIGNLAPSWAGHGFSGNVTITGDSSPYFQFVIDTSNYTNVQISVDYRRDSNWGGGSAGTPTVYVWSSTTGGAGSFSQIFSSTTFDSTFRSTGARTATATGSSLTYFRVNARGATNGNADMEIDNITVTGCGTAQKPTMTKTFSPDSIAINATSTLTFTLTNPNSVQLTGVTFTDALPSGLVVAATPSASTTCGGVPTWSPGAGATTLTFGSPTGATIPASGSCTVSVNIRATTSGPHTNVSGFISSTETGTNSGSGGSATATLTALQPPSLSKLFTTNPILAGGTSALVFTITNPNPNNVLSNISFTDTFPAGLTTANPPAASQCNGTVTSTSSSITLSGGSIPAGGSCTVAVNVTAANAGTYVNTSGTVSTVISGVTSTGNTTTDTLTVNPPHPSISVLKQISTSSSGPWLPFVTVTPGANIYYLFTIENTGDVALSPVSVTDATVNTASCSWPASLPVASALNNNHIATCVVGPLTALSGDNPNTATASGTYSGTTYNSLSSTADYLGAAAGFSLVKQISTSASGPWSTAISGVAPSSNVYYKFTVVNTGGLPLSGINVTDIVPSVNTLAASCTFSDPLAVGNATTCTVGPVSAPAIAGTNSNTATAHGTNSGTTFDTAPSSASYTVTTNPPDLIATKSHSPAGNALLNTAFTWTLTTSNPGAGDATFADGQVILSDPLPANATYGSPTTGNFTNITNSANISCSIVSGTLSCVASGAPVVVGANTGSFDVSVSTTPGATGSLSNTVAVDPRGNIAETNETNNNGSDTVTVVSSSPDLSLVKTDGSITYTPGAALTYTITVTNAATVMSTGTVADSFPASLTNISWTCSGTGGATCTASGNGNINDSVSIPVGQSVTYTVNANVLSNATGNLVNTATASLSSGTDPTPANNSSTDTDTPTLVSDLEVTKTDGVTNINTGAATTYTVVVTNHGPSDADNSLFTDPAVASLNVTSVACGSATGGAVCPTAGNTTVALMQGAGIAVPTLPSGGSVTFTVGATVTASTGSVANTAAIAPPAGVTDPGTFPNSAMDTNNAIAIIAVDDAGAAVNGTTGGQSFANVLINDTLNGNPATLATVTLTQASTTNPGVTLDITTGTINVAPGTPAGNYVVTYQICDQANPTVCDTATVTVPVLVIDAVNDTGSTVIGAAGGQSLANVLANDTLNGNSATLANVNFTQVLTTNPGVTLDLTSGAVNVAPGTPAGNYTVTYQICDQANPTFCDTATVTVPVSAAPIVAVDDSASGVNNITGATAVLNIFNNDTLNGAPVIPSAVTLTEIVPDPSGALTLNPNGTVDVAPGTAPGTYQLTYQICEVLNPTNCATAVVRITVIAPAPPLARDDNATTPFHTPVTLSNITANDSASGIGNSILISTIDLDPALSGQQTSFTDSSGNQWSVNTTTGEVTFSPAANFTGIATIPYSVQDAVGQSASANLSVTVGPPASIRGTVFNDANLSGTQGTGEGGLGSVKVDLYDSTGTTLIATVTTTVGGSYSFSNLAPGNYLVVETDLAGYVSTTPNSVATTVSAGGSATVNFGDYLLPNSTPSGIIGMVFNDANGNGVQDSGESILSGVTIQLRNNVGTVIATATTDGLGSYSFPNLAAGMYTVTEIDPSGFISTTLNNVAVTLSAGTTATINFGDQTSGTAQIVDPAVTKYGSPTTATVGSAVVYTITVGNNGNSDATNVVLTDTKPSFLDVLSITISPNPGLTPSIAGNIFTINFGTVTPIDIYIVTVVTRVNSLGQPPGGSNNASITSASATDRPANNAFSAALQITSSSGGGVRRVRSLPETGFAPGVVTDLSQLPREEYISAGDVTLEIPTLGIKIPIVAVPLKDGEWNVSWLGKQAGWLQGTAFPSWDGNSVLTSHVYLSNGLPGPFVDLSKLKFGDKLIVHAYGEKYTFEVQTNAVVDPSDTSAFKHEEKPWLTLLTCKGYDEKTDSYRKRVVVRAILVSITAE